MGAERLVLGLLGRRQLAFLPIKGNHHDAYPALALCADGGRDMLGQASLFAPDKALPLRKRVSVDGVITYAYPMTSAPIAGVPSDELLEFARLFLYQNIPHTASCAIGQSIRRIVRDWMAEFPDAKTPRLIVSWSDTTRHTGTVYKAANFQWLRRSKGANHGNTATSKRGARTKHTDYAHDKDCWIYWLDKSASAVSA